MEPAGSQFSNTAAGQSKAVLSVVIGTYNRLDQVKRCIESVLHETTTAIKVYVTDAGSTDGTIEYLRSIASDRIIPLLTGQRLGQARAYNDVFATIDTPYVCWLSDDNKVVNCGLDRAVEILRSDPKIGMVALKTKDLQGPFMAAPYIGGISVTGILNVNQGMLPTSVLRNAGGFSEEFRDYGIDPALTAEVLFAGYKVVYTKIVALHHYRNWSEDPTSEAFKLLKERHAVAAKLYAETYGEERTLMYQLRRQLSRQMRLALSLMIPEDRLRRSALARNIANSLSGKYINLLDPLLTLGKPYHLVQQIKSGSRRRRFTKPDS